MATKARKSRGKSRKSASSRSASKTRSKNKRARRASGATSSSRKAAAKSSTSSKRRSNAAGRKNPIGRVTRVAQEVAHQAQSAVVAGVEAIKDLGTTVVDRVTS